MGWTAEVDFETTRLCYGTVKSQINQIMPDTGTWEQSATFRLEQSLAVACYDRNDYLESVVSYAFLVD
jgi:type III restriction enzyme